MELDNEQQAVQSQRIMERRTTRQTVAVLLSFARGEARFWMLVCSFAVFRFSAIVGGKYYSEGERERANVVYGIDR